MRPALLGGPASAADGAMEPESMYRYGFESGQQDRDEGIYSQPRPDEDGADYVRGYFAGYES